MKIKIKIYYCDKIFVNCGIIPRLNMKKTSRRDFITTTTLGGIVLATPTIFAKSNPDVAFKILVNNSNNIEYIFPLVTVKIYTSLPCFIQILDGNGHKINETSELKTDIVFISGGALGNHTILCFDAKKLFLGTATYNLVAKTEINDSKNFYKELLQMLRWSLVGEMGEVSNFRFEYKIYNLFVPWIRDHTHTLKAMKYFDARLKDGFDLYAKTQRQDGMIYDNIYLRKPEPNWWDSVLEKGNFIRIIDNGNSELKRQPVEADVEYLFVECLYYSWKANGDTVWMKAGLDNCIKALKYCITDSYRWSKKYNLIKRGFTIDTWDFVHSYDQTQTGYGSGQCIDLEKNEFGIMHGDNTGFAMACNYLVEMLTIACRNNEAEEWRIIGKNILENLNKISWNTQFYTHFIPENTDFWPKRNIGNTDTNAQVSLSNAYAINRNIGNEKAKEIIKTYLKIKNNLPNGAPAEWYTIYPIFEQGFGNDNDAYEYMNGGVTTIVAGELARGAFLHGFESYGVDILTRLHTIGKKHDGYFNCTYKGAAKTSTKFNFITLDISTNVNANFSGKSQNGEPAWTGEGYDNSMFNMPIEQQTFRDIPFYITNPIKNKGKGCLILSSDKKYLKSSIITVNKKSNAIHLLHGRSGNEVLVSFTINYADNTTFTEYISSEKSGGWWYPEDTNLWKVAFRVSNNNSKNIGLGIYTFINPKSDIEIKNITFEAMKNNDSGKWFIAGITLSDMQKPYYKTTDVSFGIPDKWGSAACVYGLIEGLVGVVDTGIAMQSVRISPRWAATSETKVSTTIKYEASGGYVSYNYELLENSVNLLFTGNANTFELEVLIPTNKQVKNVILNNINITMQSKKIEDSTYILVTTSKIGVNSLQITFN